MSEGSEGFDAGDYNLFRYCANDPLDKTDPMGLEIHAPGTMDVSPEVLQAVFASARSAALQSAANPVVRGRKAAHFFEPDFWRCALTAIETVRISCEKHLTSEGPSIRLQLMGQYQAAAPRLPPGVLESQRVYTTHSHGPASEYSNNVGDRRAANDADHNGRNPLFSGVAKTASPDHVSVFVPSTDAGIRSQNKGGVEITTDDGVNAVVVKKYGN